MRSLPPHRFAAIVALGFAFLPGASARGVLPQEEPSAVTVLLGRARTLEQRGRLDLAKQDWAQVLVADPSDAEALAGLARAAKAEGRTGDAAMFTARLRAAHPADARLAALEGGSPGGDTSADLDEAARLARAGDNRGAMAIYRRVYRVNPPPGAPALAYYETEGATEDGRPAAVAGLRALADRFPADARYGVALGRLLLVSPRTRAEGRTLLEGMPGNAEAVAALRGGLGTSGQAPGTSGQAAAAKAATELAAGGVGLPPGAARSRASAPPLAPETARSAPIPTARPQAPQSAGRGAMLRTASAQGTGSLRRSAFSAEEQAAFAALNAHRFPEAGQRFRDILAKDPSDARALAGMGYLSESSGDLKSAVLFFERAQESGDRSLALTRALVNAEFQFTLQQAAGARARGDTAGAETQYRAALRERPGDPGALQGLAEILLGAGRAAEALPVFAKLTQVRPMDPEGWRGLVLAEASTGNAQAVVATAARVPEDARLPLQSDTAYELTVTAANRAQGLPSRAPGVQVARAEPPARPVPAPKPVVPKPAEPPRKAKPETESRATPGAPGASPGAAPNGTAAATTVAAPPAPTALPALAAVPEAIAADRADRVIAGERVQQAEAALLHGHNAEAAALLREALSKDPERTEAWRALVEALHNGGQDAEAAVVVSRLPGSAQPVLERDATFETTAGAVYLNAERPQEALRALARAQDIFATQRLPPPLELVLQIARLLAARGDDENLYRELMYLGQRQDLTSAQRQGVQFVWTEWAVRRARALAAGGDRRRAVALLNAAAGAFAGNPRVIYAVAEGYAGVGLPREAVALYKAQDLANAPAREVEAAVSAATAAHDFRAAGNWAKMGLQRFGGDPEMLTVVAELEQAKGHEGRALTLTEQAKANAPAGNPGQVLAAELKEANAGQGWAPHPQAAGQLSVLLAPAEAQALATGGQGAKPYLPEGGQQPGDGNSSRAAEATPVLWSYEEPSR